MTKNGRKTGNKAKGEDKPDPLKAQILRLPKSPGVYRFFDAKGALLYVGKASSLRSRVRSYFLAGAAKQPRLRILTAKIARLEFTITPTPSDALLLEQQQIRSLEPRYNVLFRDDKSYPYLRLSNHRFPRLALHRGKPDKSCYGPFANGWSVRESIRVLSQAFRLRTCTDANFANRSRPCLLHQIGHCSAPCVGHPDAKDYADDVAAARAFLAGGSGEVVERLGAKMEAAAARQDFEEAAKFRDSIGALADVRATSAVTGGASEADFIGMARSSAGAALRLTAVRGGRQVAEIDSFPRNTAGADDIEVMAGFLSHHYDRHPPPPRIVVRIDMAAEELGKLIGGGKTVVVTHPRGSDLERLRLTQRNAEQALASHGSSRAAIHEALADLGAALAMPPPERIECFDVSHTMGEAATAACVVCIDGAIDPKQYRRFNLRITEAGDDYGGLAEAITRRYRPSAKRLVPELLLIDGGAGQLSAAAAALAEVGIADLPLLGIAKGADRTPGKETLITGAGELIEMAPHSPAFRLLQRIRDEAHRFALAGHRRRRDKSRAASSLDDIIGIGPNKRRMLLNEFGGLAGLRDASPRDLARIKGIGREMARRIYQALHP